MKTFRSVIFFSFVMTAFVVSSIFAQDANQPSVEPVSSNQPTSSQSPESPPDAGKTEATSSTVPATEEDKNAPAQKDNDSQGTVSVQVKQSSSVNMSGSWQKNPNSVVSIRSDAYLPADKTAEAVVAILGNATADGPVKDSVVSLVGSSTANNKVRDAVVSILGSSTVNMEAREAVSIVGNTYVNGHVRGSVVSLCGGVKVGPNARIDGEVVALGGPVKRAPDSKIGGEIVEFGIIQDLDFFELNGLRAWFSHALLWGRLLAWGPHLGWVWMVAGACLLLYALITLVFERAVSQCTETLRLSPGKTILVSFLTAIITPLIYALLSLTVIGAVLFPLVVLIGMFFGKAAILMWLGRCCRIAHPVLAVVVGGLLLTVLYLVPVLGLVLWAITSQLGLGLAVYTWLSSMKNNRKNGQTSPNNTMTPVATSMEGSNSPANTSGISSGSAAYAVASPAIPLPGLTPIPEAALPRAGFWIRLVASCIDIILVSVIAQNIYLKDFTAIILAVYCGVLWGLRGSTIGGIICGIKIVRLDGSKVTWTVALVRVLGAFLSAAMAGIGFVWVAFDPERQSWHDKIAGTTIVHAPRGNSLV